MSTEISHWLLYWHPSPLRPPATVVDLHFDNLFRSNLKFHLLGEVWFVRCYLQVITEAKLNLDSKESNLSARQTKKQSRLWGNTKVWITSRDIKKSKLPTKKREEMHPKWGEKAKLLPGRRKSQRVMVCAAVFLSQHLQAPPILAATLGCSGLLSGVRYEHHDLMQQWLKQIS